jgi:hypothetical protein
MSDVGINPEWVSAWSGWLREVGAHEGDCILAWARLGRKGGDVSEYTRQLQPHVINGSPHWMWTTAKPAASLLNFWLVLDNKTFPAATCTDIAYSEHASRPITAEDLLEVARRIVDESTALTELGDMRRPLLQGASAISAGFFEAEPDRRAIAVGGYRILQIRRLGETDPLNLSETAC